MREEQMEDFAKEDRGIFQGLKVPFCLNAIILAFVAYVIFIAGAKCIEWATGQEAAYSTIVLDLKSRLVARVPILKRPIQELVVNYAFVDYRGVERKAEQERAELEQRKMKESALPEGVPASEAGALPQSYLYESPSVPWWMYLVYGFWFLVIWSFFAGAINRIAAYRIARDESITIPEALVFATRTWTNHFLAILFIGIFIAACFFLCALGGLICRIPYAGEIILIPGFLLVLLAVFLIILLLAGLLFGFNIISAAIGVDKVDSFDAISRSYSYVLGRPWHTLLFTLLPMLFLFFFFYFAQFFLDLVLQSVGYGMGEKFDNIRRYILSRDYDNTLLGQDTTIIISGVALRIIYLLTGFFIVATAIAYWLSANTKAYFLLRKDVDGDEVDEMFLEEEELPPEEKPEEAAKEEKPAQEKSCQAEKPEQESSE